MGLKDFFKKVLDLVRKYFLIIKKLPREDKFLIIHLGLSFNLTYILFRIFHKVSEIVQISEIRLLENLLVGLLTSYFFYIIVVFFPEYRRIKIIRKNFNYQINLFKTEVMATFMHCLNMVVNDEEINKLKDIKNFRDFFNAEYEKGQTRWQRVLTIIDGDANKLDSLLKDLVFLREECHFIMGKVQLNDDWTYGFMKKLSNFIYMLKSDESVSAEDISGFFWPLFSGWSFVSGYRDVDLLKEMVDRI